MYIVVASGNADHMPWPSEDPSFVSSVERHYLAEIGRDREQVTADGHGSRLAAAVYAADRTNGGLRFRHLDERIRTELERRLRRARPRG